MDAPGRGTRYREFYCSLDRPAGRIQRSKDPPFVVMVRDGVHRLQAPVSCVGPRPRSQESLERHQGL
jgi:hypothetical protein